MKNLMQEIGSVFLKKNFAVFLILLLVGLITFLNSFDNAFLMDDFPMLVGNLSIGAPDFLQLDPSAKTQVYFRPVTHFLNLITFSLFGQNPFGYHFVNLILFVSAGFVFFLLIEKVSANRWVAFWSALLFVVHPINGVCINYKNATGDPFFALALGLALLHAMEGADTNSWNEKILTMIWLSMALLCHEIAFAFPLYLAGLLYFSGRYSFRNIVRACFYPTILLIGYFLFRLQFASLGKAVLIQGAAMSFSFSSFLSDIGQIAFWYLSKLVIMKDIVLIWDVPSGGSNIFGIIFIIFIGASGAAVIFLRKRNPLAALGLTWFWIGFIPVLFASFSRPWFGVIVEPFWLVISSLGSFLFAASIFNKVFGKHIVLLTIALFFYLAMIILPAAWRYNDLWGNSIAYCEYWKTISPRNFFPRFWLAYSLIDEKEYLRARDVLTDLVDGGLRYEWTYGNLGIAEYHLNNYKAAEDAFVRALRFNSQRGDTYYYLGMVFAATGEIKKAEQSFETALRLSPELVDTKKQLESIRARRADH